MVFVTLGTTHTRDHPIIFCSASNEYDIQIRARPEINIYARPVGIQKQHPKTRLIALNGIIAGGFAYP